MQRRMVVAVLCGVLVWPSAAWAWGPHPNIGMAGVKVLDKDDPFRNWIGNVGLVDGLSWWNDMAGGAAIVSVGEYRVYARDCFEIPGLPLQGYTGHGGPETGTYEAFFSRLLQALHTESTAASLGWLGAVLHDTEDTGAPPHAAKCSGRLHEMENWIEAAKIDITGYRPQLLGRTEAEALQGYVARLHALHAYALERAVKIKPFAEANDRAQAEPLILECANESARAVADVLHTIGHLQAQLQRQPGTASLAGTITAPADPHRLTARIVLAGTKFSTLADLQGRYTFRNLPPGTYQGVILMPRCVPHPFTVTLAADQQTTQDVTLKVNHNLLRNGDLSVRWVRPEQPDGWRISLSGDKTWHCTSEPFLVQPGQQLQVQVTWTEGAQGQANIVWEDGQWVAERAVGPESPPLLITVPEAQRASTATISVRTKGEFVKTVRNVAVSVRLPATP